MQILQGKKIVLGITGGIAAYKMPELVRRLIDQGAEVRVVMTESAKAFITPLTLQAVSGNSVSDTLLDTEAERAMGHIALAKWADLLLIAPASANSIANITHGLANDLLGTIVLATNATIAIAPAMNQQMWHAEITQENIQKLKNRGMHIWGPGQGEQACGDVGFGRLLEVPELVDQVCGLYQEKKLLNQHWVITAGPTREAIDPVRYISNHSSGKMGYSIAQAALNAGAKVTLISGPVNLSTPETVELIKVTSAEQMHQEAIKQAKNADVFVACAAVADYRVAEIAEQKIKKTADNHHLQINLVKNPDIVADVAALADKPFTVGFAAETQDVEHYALDKLKRKNLDLIAANNVALSGQGFNSDNNALTVFSATSQHDISLMSKSDVAKKLVDIIAEQLDEKH
ncbi:bifunctional phosphopantothenoylcysteine decarboxylase/phosphopantothenate--cysteine ligase CoaBC [Colwellia sp. 1_MG-2023]|uniref:bifunctional phosphopantothenoylcysteine decarboxylase/phosphopantothenate--cysteine ligase CoaBC n=1 Tax=Colwellia sp. 1_MG-2023 TaxID=3062649 RepID=UPI0026E15FAA|nr:bifunctional phosphopantothenoylcysteine decarboxylase/phosphopantothenate--cysteine ligase CoaBC [Colwellia sp. 1_MG-2023]MDO6445308.1 bifunctional phosphopantothenoylcysteine decarboxylase/phosphopantothenate--cysteine ligase CoaBC [Colwellia sp. 1_MG-2023]